MTDKTSGGYPSRAVTIRRLGWLGAVMLLGAALLIPGATVAAHNGQCGCSYTKTSTTGFGNPVFGYASTSTVS